jgi:hypothetical protein
MIDDEIVYWKQKTEIYEKHPLESMIVVTKEKEVMSWQPIETAPKDEWILCYEPNKGFTGGHCYVCKWAYDNQFWYDKISDILFIKEGEDYTVKYLTCVPTHWMPLPEPPEESISQH